MAQVQDAAFGHLMVQVITDTQMRTLLAALERSRDELRISFQDIMYAYSDDTECINRAFMCATESKWSQGPCQESHKGPKACIPFSLHPCINSALHCGFEVMMITV